jgi:hypothetical protein
MTLNGGALLKRSEIWIVWALAAIALAAVSVLRGQAGIIWDALNHHIYLGWIAEQPRFDRDFLAANWQSYQYPYLYWPAYKLAMAGVSGVTAGVVLTLIQSLVVPPLWLVTRSLCPGDRVEDIALRAVGVALALSGGVTLSLLDTTSNDVLAGVPLLWAVALGLLANGDGVPPRRRLGLVAASGLCAGLSVAFKLSNGPLALVLPVLWAAIPSPARPAMERILLGGVATVLAFLLALAPWGWVLWEHFGNPFYPLLEDQFNPVRAVFDWKRP